MYQGILTLYFLFAFFKVSHKSSKIDFAFGETPNTNVPLGPLCP